MEISTPLFEAIETVSTCLYSLSEEGYEYLDCIPEAINALIYISEEIGVKPDLATILSRKAKPVTEMTEDEVAHVITALRSSLENPIKAKSVIEDIYSSLISITECIPAAIQQPLIAIEAT